MEALYLAGGHSGEMHGLLLHFEGDIPKQQELKIAAFTREYF
jgi:hypothetical protein